jgi:hypothetical protein
LYKRLKPEVQAKVASNTPHGTARVAGASRRADGSVSVHFRVDDLHRPDFYLEFEIPLNDITAAAAAPDL